MPSNPTQSAASADFCQQGHALIALVMMSILAATPPEPTELQIPAPAPVFVAIKPFDERLALLPADTLDSDEAATTAAPSDLSSGLFAS